MDICFGLHLACKASRCMPHFFNLCLTGSLKRVNGRELMGLRLSALVHIHSLGMVHRDVKAENVVLQRQSAVLIDFGISADVNDKKEMLRPVGSPGYVAPEMVAAQPAPCDEKA